MYDNNTDFDFVGILEDFNFESDSEFGEFGEFDFPFEMEEEYNFPHYNATQQSASDALYPSQQDCNKPPPRQMVILDECGLKQSSSSEQGTALDNVLQKLHDHISWSTFPLNINLESLPNVIKNIIKGLYEDKISAIKKIDELKIWFDIVKKPREEYIKYLCDYVTEKRAVVPPLFANSPIVMPSHEESIRLQIENEKTFNQSRALLLSLLIYRCFQILQATKSMELEMLLNESQCLNELGNLMTEKGFLNSLTLVTICRAVIKVVHSTLGINCKSMKTNLLTATVIFLGGNHKYQLGTNQSAFGSFLEDMFVEITGHKKQQRAPKRNLTDQKKEQSVPKRKRESP